VHFFSRQATVKLGFMDSKMLECEYIEFIVDVSRCLEIVMEIHMVTHSTSECSETKGAKESLSLIIQGNTQLFLASWMHGGRAHPVSSFSGAKAVFAIMPYLKNRRKFSII
jgi:hypothetical protein